MSPNALVPEMAVKDYAASRAFYLDLLGFSLCYERPEEGFGYFTLGTAELMLDEIGLGRTFDDGHIPTSYPAGRGVNLQIRCAAVDPILKRLAAAKVALYLAPEVAWYRVHGEQQGQRQFVVADPDGYLLRFWEPLSEN
ncbi:MAG: VOC family protein [Thalassovita sp.]